MSKYVWSVAILPQGLQSWWACCHGMEVSHGHHEFETNQEDHVVDNPMCRAWRKASGGDGRRSSGGNDITYFSSLASSATMGGRVPWSSEREGHPAHSKLSSKSDVQDMGTSRRCDPTRIGLLKQWWWPMWATVKMMQLMFRCGHDDFLDKFWAEVECNWTLMNSMSIFFKKCRYFQVW